MNNTTHRALVVGLLLIAGLSLQTGCAAFRAQTSTVNVDTADPMSERFAFTDLRDITQSFATELSASPLIAKHDTAPIMMIAGVQNRTSAYLDTKNLTDRLRTLLFQTGAVQFVNEARREDLLREQGYQAAQATPETQAGIGQQLGAKYMISGSLTEMADRSPRQVRVSKTVRRYYKLTLEVTDLETGLLAWTSEREFAREARQPLVGW
jgi:penicillin-binding protein activator